MFISFVLFEVDGLDTAFLRSGLYCASGPMRSRAAHWREPGEQVGIQVSWGFSSELSKSMTRTAGLRPPWNKGSLVQSKSALRVESRAWSSCWEELGDIFRENKWSHLWTSQLP